MEFKKKKKNDINHKSWVQQIIYLNKRSFLPIVKLEKLLWSLGYNNYLRCNNNNFIIPNCLKNHHLKGKWIGQIFDVKVRRLYNYKPIFNGVSGNDH